MNKADIRGNRKLSNPVSMNEIECVINNLPTKKILG